MDLNGEEIEYLNLTEEECEKLGIYYFPKCVRYYSEYLVEYKQLEYEKFLELCKK